MTTESKPNAMREYARLRALSCVTRMTRLLELDAPPSILMTELMLLEERLQLLDAKAYGEARALCGLEDIKRRAGFCTEVNCTALRSPGHGDLCAACATAGADENDLDDPMEVS